MAVLGHESPFFEVYWVDYAEGIIAAGGIPVFLPLSLDPSEIIPRLDGILMSGGADIDPERYGADPEPELQSIEPVRDDFELKVLEKVYENELPVAGICRGLQILNVYAGGTISRRSSARCSKGTPSSRVHEVTFDDGSLFSGPLRVINRSELFTSSKHR